MDSSPSSGFVIALCAVDRAMPIPQPKSPPLNRYRFFLTRRTAQGREFFVLHMGHFATAEEAEKYTEMLRSTYPNAYVCEATDRLNVAPSGGLTDTQVLKVLEVRKPEPAFEPAKPPAPKPAKPAIRSLLDESLEAMAAREVVDTGAHETLLNDTGVRHLSIEVVKRRSWGRGRSRSS